MVAALRFCPLYLAHVKLSATMPTALHRQYTHTIREEGGVMRLQKIEEMRRREKRCCSCRRESSIAEERRVAVPAEERSAQKRKHFDELAAREEIEVISVNVMH
uniref:Uncharacterized protein n=1 Tax=Oryza meridionalis TaxID=40149 RepID=A0A0E0DE20_9ORYZ